MGGVQMTKKEALEKMMTPEMKDGIRELQSAVEVYNRNSNDITYGEVILAFFTAAKYEKVAFCPVESMHMDKGAFEPGKVNTTIGKCYVLCTSPEEAALCPEPVIVVIGMDHIVATAAEDPACGGLCLNPYGGYPCTLPREYIRRILGMRPSERPTNLTPAKKRDSDGSVEYYQ